MPKLRTRQLWIATIKAATFTLEKGATSGRPRGTRTPDLVRKVDDMLSNDPRLSTWDLAELLDVDQKSVYRIVTEDLDLKHVCSVWVSAKELSCQKQERSCHVLQTYTSTVINQSQSGIYCVEDEIWYKQKHESEYS